MALERRAPSSNSQNGSKSIKYRRLRPFKTDEIKVLLLENVSQVAANLLRDAGYQVSDTRLHFKLRH